MFAIGFGTLVRQELVGDGKAGWISRTKLTLAEILASIKQMLKDDFF